MASSIICSTGGGIGSREDSFRPKSSQWGSFGVSRTPSSQIRLRILWRSFLNALFFASTAVRSSDLLKFTTDRASDSVSKVASQADGSPSAVVSRRVFLAYVRHAEAFICQVYPCLASCPFVRFAQFKSASSHVRLHSSRCDTDTQCFKSEQTLGATVARGASGFDAGLHD